MPATLWTGDLALFEGRYTDKGTFIYVCQDHTCKLPVKTVAEALEILGESGKRNAYPLPSSSFDGLN